MVADKPGDGRAFATGLGRQTGLKLREGRSRETLRGRV
jgi:hypothetical protein